MNASDEYNNPLIARYASQQMSALWSDQRKFSTWRKLWIALAESEQALGLPITDVQLEAMRRHQDSINFERAREYESQLRHDVMAHVHAYGEQCPESMPIIHLGATSCFVTDNTDLILIRDGLELVRQRIVGVIDELATFASQYRDLACLGFTHLQPAQPTTLGKRACLWTYDLILDLVEVEHRLQSLRARSTKGTTGTQASFLKLFEGDHEKVRQLEQEVAKRIGFNMTYAVTGQTYSRKVDSQLLDCLSGIAQSAHKIATDLRILAHRKEVEEPFESKQIGSSAMPYKRNPMRSERVCALARFVMSLQTSPPTTHATQWMERTLDDSANRRLVIPQAFLAVDAILILMRNICGGLVVYPKVVERWLNEELPFMATENIMMAAVGAGGDRQELHERIRQHSHAAGHQIKAEGKPNDLLERIEQDPAFSAVDVRALIQAHSFVGRAPEQVDEFIRDEVTPIRNRYGDDLNGSAEQLRV